jgi:prefoldin subunit 5
VDTACAPVSNAPTFEDSERASLLQRIEELEHEAAQKDQEIARLQQQLQKVRLHQSQPSAKPSSPSGDYKQQYEALKFQYDKLREALAVNGKIRRVRVKSAQVVKLAM